jgi:hypothetical protein
MKSSKVWTLLFLLTVGVAAGLYAQGLTDGILITIPHDVIVHDKQLPAGEYEIRKVTNAANPILRFYNRDEMKYETPVLPINLEKTKVEENPKVVLHKVGNSYYLTEVWILPDKLGYQVPLPSNVRALEKELGESVYGKVKENKDNKESKENKK